MKLFFDATLGNVNAKTGAYMDSGYYLAAREVARIPGLLPMRIYYPGQTKTYAGQPVDGAKQALVEQLGRDWSTEKGLEFVMLHDERSDWCIPPIENPLLESNVAKLQKLLQWYQFGHPGAKVGMWLVCPPPPGHHWNSINPAAYAAYQAKCKPITDVLDLAISCHYVYKPNQQAEWLEELKQTRIRGLEYPQPWIPTIAPIHQHTFTPLSADEIEYQIDMCQRLGAAGVLIWCGNAGYLPNDVMQRIERLAKE